MSSFLPLVPIVKRPVPCPKCGTTLIPESDGDKPTVCPNCTGWRPRDLDRDAMFAKCSKWIYRLGHRFADYARTDPEDLSQEITLRALRCFKSYDPRRGKFTTWLGYVARSTARLMRQQAIGNRNAPRVLLCRTAGTVEDMAVSREPSPVVGAATSEAVDTVRSAMAKLTPIQRHAVRCRFGIDGQARRTMVDLDQNVTASANSQTLIAGLNAIRRRLGVRVTPRRQYRKSKANRVRRQCQNCSRHPASRPRGLCWNCYYKPGVRDRFPSTSKYARRRTTPAVAA